MKRYGHLYERIISLDNLRLADEKARKGKTHTYGVRIHDRNREANILKLHDQLIGKTYHTSEYSVFKVYEPKEREIHRLPYYPDRIVHHAIMNVIEPIWRSVFTYNTYTCIKGRGIQACAKRIETLIRRYDGRPLYCLKIDIRKFYPSVDHEVLKQIVRRKIKDQDALWLIEEIIDSAEGLPIGNYLSQYLANLVLAYFMHWGIETLPALIQEALHLPERPALDMTEYADDIAFLSDDKDVLHEAQRLAANYLRTNVRLEMKDNWQIFPIATSKQNGHGRALDYVGWQFYREQKLIRKSIKHNFAKAAARADRRLAEPDTREYKQLLAGWLGWAKYSNSKHLLKTIINPKYYASVL